MEGFRVYTELDEVEEVRKCLEVVDKVREKALNLREEMVNKEIEYEKRSFFFFKRKHSISLWQKACEPFYSDYFRFTEAQVLHSSGKISANEFNILKRLDVYRSIDNLVSNDGNRFIFLSSKQELALNIVRNFLEKDYEVLYGGGE